MAQDIAPTSFWKKIPFIYPYALLARWDRPIGFWLTLWPALWGLVMAPSFALLNLQQCIYFIALFFAGAIAVRGAGCTINDLWDRRLDAKVERTKIRPLPSGQISLPAAFMFLALQLCIGAWILFQLNPVAIYIGLAAIPLIAIYPLMKRVTWWPQMFLGIVFNMGALIGWAALENSLGLVPVFLYAAAFFWTIAYDTVYAHLDAADDAMIGIKSTARYWGPDSKTWIFCFWLACLGCFLGALILKGGTWVSYGMFALAAISMLTAHALWNPLNQHYTLGFFRLQAKIGLLLTLAALAPVLF